MKSLTETLQTSLNESRQFMDLENVLTETITECETENDLDALFATIIDSVSDALGTFEMLADEDDDKKGLYLKLEKLAKKHKLL